MQWVLAGRGQWGSPPSLAITTISDITRAWTTSHPQTSTLGETKPFYNNAVDFRVGLTHFSIWCWPLWNMIISWKAGGIIESGGSRRLGKMGQFLAEFNSCPQAYELEAVFCPIEKDLLFWPPQASELCISLIRVVLAVSHGETHRWLIHPFKNLVNLP